MVDSVAVFEPGFRVTDNSTGAPISGAVLTFFDAGTTNPKTVYSDLLLTTALGTSVTCDSLGRPTSDGTTPVDIFVGTASYKVVIKDSLGTTIETKDNRKGASVSASSANVSVTAVFPVVTKSLNYAVLSADQNTCFAGNCSGGSFTFTLPSAVTVGTGWAIKIQHAGSANKVLIATSGGQTLSEGSKSYGGQMVLSFNGEDVEIVSDGGNWRVVSHTAPFVEVAQGIIPVVSRLATSPGSPAAGDMYILTGTGGAWSTFTTNDIALYTGAAWTNFTPPTNCGWRAWVQAENLAYVFNASAWVVETATSTVQGSVLVSTQAIMETGTSTTAAVLVGHTQFFPGVPKWWVDISVSAGTPSVSASYNNTSITDTATGDVAITIATDFSSANWCPLPGHVTDAAGINPRIVGVKTATLAAGTISLVAQNPGGSSVDPSNWTCAGLGDQ